MMRKMLVLLVMVLVGVQAYPVPAGGLYQLPTQTPTFVEPEGCLDPPDDYTRVTIGNVVLNQRTIAMLEHAQELYGGPIELTGRHLTQGSYNVGAVALSFGPMTAAARLIFPCGTFPRTGRSATMILNRWCMRCGWRVLRPGIAASRMA